MLTPAAVKLLRASDIPLAVDRIDDLVDAARAFRRYTLASHFRSFLIVGGQRPVGVVAPVGLAYFRLSFRSCGVKIGLMKDLPPNGTVVRAKRAGWNEKLTAEQRLDLDAFDYPADAVDLKGKLQVVSGHSEELGTIAVVLVGGQEADPATVESA